MTMGLGRLRPYQHPSMDNSGTVDFECPACFAPIRVELQATRSVLSGVKCRCGASYTVERQPS